MWGFFLISPQRPRGAKAHKEFYLYFNRLSGYINFFFESSCLRGKFIKDNGDTIWI